MSSGRLRHTDMHLGSFHGNKENLIYLFDHTNKIKRRRTHWKAGDLTLLICFAVVSLVDPDQL